jgi:hypothetical protein
MSALAKRALASGAVAPTDRAWTTLRLRQGHFSVHALAALDRIAGGRGWTALDARCARAKRLGYHGPLDRSRWDINQQVLVEKWFREQGLNSF